MPSDKVTDLGNPTVRAIKSTNSLASEGWSLQEYDQNGFPIGPELTPWKRWSIFKIDRAQVAYEFDPGLADEGKLLPAIAINCSLKSFNKAKNTSDPLWAPKFSILGASYPLRDISMTILSDIEKKGSGNEEQSRGAMAAYADCTAGCIDTVTGTTLLPALLFTLTLPRSTLIEMVEVLKDDSEEFLFSIKDAGGLFAVDSPYGLPDEIKVLSREIRLTGEASEMLPDNAYVGAVGKFHISLKSASLHFET